MPLTKAGDYATENMINRSVLARLNLDAVVINTARGEVLNEEDLLAMAQPLYWVIDVWQNEPHINFELMKQALIATPHIAGHTVLGKWRGTQIIYDACAEKFGWPDKKLPPLGHNKPHAQLFTVSEQYKSLLSVNPRAAEKIFYQLRNAYAG